VFDALNWRLVGPFRAGRSVAVAGDPNDPLVFYFGGCAGGVFKTTDGGATWRPVSDGFLKTGSVGAIAVAESDPNVIYIGMGESNIRANVSHGDGVYRSDDAGETWHHLGLSATRHIGRIRVHPQNPDLVFVAAFGHAWGPNPERGVYRSNDGGRTWERVLFVDDHTGAIDITLDPTNPRNLYASVWEAQRTPYSLISGGAGSGIFKSIDGGDTWNRLDDNPGLPKGIKGRIGLAVSPARPSRIWATIEAHEAGIFRSDDSGGTWRCVSDDREQLQRPWYFMHIFADPVDPDTMYSLNLQAWKSIDGGATFASLPIAHGDTHDLWIDARDPQRMIMGNDGGATISFDGGETWSTQYNQPTSQFYHVITDDQFPYRIYGSQQDNTTVSIANRADRGVITRLDWHPVGGHESGYIAVNPDNPDIVYGGVFSNRITRYDHKSGQVQDVTVWPEDPIGQAAKDVKYRFSWTFPIVFSPHDANVLYTTGNHVFRTTDEGHSWEVVSPDLTRNDVSTLQPSGGPITPDNYATEYYATIFAFAESPREAGLLWAGSDDGLIHVSRDNGKSWENVTPTELPEWALISLIDPSPYDPAVAYVAATRYKLDDPHPYLLKTEDYGKTWALITEGIPDNDLTRVIRADLRRKGLLYAGTETGVYVSFDDGGIWQPLQLNLPVCPIYDLDVRHGDLVAGTHGRSFWVLDDLTPLQHWTDVDRQQPGYLFPPRPAYRLNQPIWAAKGVEPNHKTYLTGAGEVVAIAYAKQLSNGATKLEPLDAGENPPSGIIVNYYLGDALPGGISLTFRDSEGQIIQTFSSQHTNAHSRSASGPTAHPGLNRFVWDMHYPDALPLEEGRLFNYWARAPHGPLAPPGAYEVELDVDGKSYRRAFGILKDPRVSSNEGDLKAQFALLLKIRDKLSEVHGAINRGRLMRHQIVEWSARINRDPQNAQLAGELLEIDNRIKSVIDQLVQEKIRIGCDFAVYAPQVNSKLVALASFVGSSETLPAAQHREVFAELAARADRQIWELNGIVKMELSEVVNQIRSSNIPLITIE